MTIIRSNASSRRVGDIARRTGLAAALAIAAFVAACNTAQLLNVEAPNSVSATVFDDPRNATLMINSLIGDFECAFGGFVVAEGIATDELQDATITAATVL